MILGVLQGKRRRPGSITDRDDDFNVFGEYPEWLRPASMNGPLGFDFLYMGPTEWKLDEGTKFLGGFCRVDRTQWL